MHYAAGGWIKHNVHVFIGKVRSAKASAVEITWLSPQLGNLLHRHPEANAPNFTCPARVAEVHDAVGELCSHVIGVGQQRGPNRQRPRCIRVHQAEEATVKLPRPRTRPVAAEP